jgi:hypothetical protein
VRAKAWPPVVRMASTCFAPLSVAEFTHAFLYASGCNNASISMSSVLGLLIAHDMRKNAEHHFDGR